MTTTDKYSYCAAAMEMARAISEDAWTRRVNAAQDDKLKATARHGDYVRGLSDAFDILSRYFGLPKANIPTSVASNLADLRRTHLDDLLDCDPSEEDVVVADYTYLTSNDSLRTLLTDATVTMAPTRAAICRYVLKVGEATDAQIAEALKSNFESAREAGRIEAARKATERAARDLSQFFETRSGSLAYRVALEKSSWGGPWMFVYRSHDHERLPLAGRQLERVVAHELRRAQRDRLVETQGHPDSLPNLAVLERSLEIPSELTGLDADQRAADLERRMSMLRQSEAVEYIRHEAVSQAIKGARYHHTVSPREIFRTLGDDLLTRIEVRLRPSSTELVWHQKADVTLLDKIAREVGNVANLPTQKTLISTFVYSFQAPGDHRSGYAAAIEQTGLPLFGNIEFVPRVHYASILRDPEFSSLLPPEAAPVTTGPPPPEPYLTVFEFDIHNDWRTPGDVLTRLRVEASVPWTRVKSADDGYLLAAIESTNRTVEKYALDQYIIPLARALGSR